VRLARVGQQRHQGGQDGQHGRGRQCERGHLQEPGAEQDDRSQAALEEEERPKRQGEAAPHERDGQRGQPPLVDARQNEHAEDQAAETQQVQLLRTCPQPVGRPRSLGR
jgi:hypothetical protein